MSNTNQRNNELGALWKKKSANGNTFLTGTVNGQRIVVFSNADRKKKKMADDGYTQEQVDKLPDYTILASEDRPGYGNNTGGGNKAPAAPARPARPATQGAPAPARRPVPATPEGPADDDVAF